MVWAGLVIFVFLFPENYFDYCGGGGNSIIISEDCEDCGQCLVFLSERAAGCRPTNNDNRRQKSLTYRNMRATLGELRGVSRFTFVADQDCFTCK